MAFTLVAAAECWNFVDVRPITCIEHVIWRLARRAGSSFQPDNQTIKGILPSLRFMVQRDEEYWDRLWSGRSGWGQGTTFVDRVATHGFHNSNSLTKVRFHKGTVLEESEGIVCLPIDNWTCKYCSRELGNLFLACKQCHLQPLGPAEKECWFCADCFLQGKYTTSQCFHQIPQQPPEFHARTRFFPVEDAQNYLDQCVSQLQEAEPPVSELEETEDTLKYLLLHARPGWH